MHNLFTCFKRKDTSVHFKDEQMENECKNKHKVNENSFFTEPQHNSIWKKFTSKLYSWRQQLDEMAWEDLEEHKELSKIYKPYSPSQGPI